MGHAHWTVQDNSSTHHRHSTAAHTDKEWTPSTHLTLFTFTHQRTIMINDDQQSTFNE